MLLETYDNEFAHPLCHTKARISLFVMPAAAAAGKKELPTGASAAAPTAWAAVRTQHSIEKPFLALSFFGIILIWKIKQEERSQT
jgi:hypothetical protein